MKAMTYTAARQNLAKTMEKVCEDRAPVIVTRKASNSVVIMSLEDYEAPGESRMNTGSFIKSQKMRFMSPSCGTTTDHHSPSLTFSAIRRNSGSQSDLRSLFPRRVPSSNCW